MAEDGWGAEVAAADDDDGEEDDGDDETAALDAWDAGGALVVPAADEDVPLRDEDAMPLVASDEAPRELEVLPLLVAGRLLPPEALAPPLEVFPTAPDEAVRDAVLVPLLLPAPTRHTPSRHTSPPAHAAGQGRPHRPSWHS